MIPFYEPPYPNPHYFDEIWTPVKPKNKNGALIGASNIYTTLYTLT